MDNSYPHWVLLQVFFNIPCWPKALDTENIQMFLVQGNVQKLVTPHIPLLVRSTQKSHFMKLRDNGGVIDKQYNNRTVGDYYNIHGQDCCPWKYYK